MDTQHLLFYIILSTYVRSILFYQNKDHNVRQIRFHVCIKMHRCKRRAYKRRTLFGQPNSIHKLLYHFLLIIPSITSQLKYFDNEQADLFSNPFKRNIAIIRSIQDNT